MTDRTSSGGHFIAWAGTELRRFSDLPRISSISLTAVESHSGPKTRPKLTPWRNWFARSALAIRKDRNYALSTARDITPSFSKIPMATNLRFVAANNLSWRNERVGGEV